jgi:hypothetical protein
MLASPDQQISLTDPDSRSMATSGRGSGVVGYNVQVAVDTDHHLIIAHEVTNSGSDRAQLANIASQAKEVLGVDELQAVADRGYYSGAEILACHEAGIAVTLPKPVSSGIEAKGRFGKQDFRYVAEEDVYICPAGEKLSLHQRGEWVGPTPILDQRLSKLRHQTPLHHWQGATDHGDGSMNTYWRLYRSASIKTRRRCGYAARQWNISSPL